MRKDRVTGEAVPMGGCKFEILTKSEIWNHTEGDLKGMWNCTDGEFRGVGKTREAAYRDYQQSVAYELFDSTIGWAG